MKVAEIPANELVTMTPELYQEFAQSGCVPACHFTHSFINIGDKFHLSTVNIRPTLQNGEPQDKPKEEKDVMLSEPITIQQFEDYQDALFEQAQQRRIMHKKESASYGRTGCFRINGVIVP